MHIQSSIIFEGDVGRVHLKEAPLVLAPAYPT